MSKQSKPSNAIVEAMAAADAIAPVAKIASAAARVADMQMAIPTASFASQGLAGLETGRQSGAFGALDRVERLGSAFAQSVRDAHQWSSLARPTRFALSTSEVMAELDRGFGNTAAMARLAVDPFAGFGLKAELAMMRGLADRSALFRFHEEHSKLNRFFDQSASFGQTIAELQLGFPETLASQLQRVADFEGRLKSLLPIASHEAWSSHMSRTAVDSLDLLSNEWPFPVAILTTPEGVDGALLNWLGKRRDGVMIQTVAIAPDVGDASTPVVSDVECFCAICDGPMVTLGPSQWIGPMRGTKHRRIFPFCSQCWTHEREDEGFLLRSLLELTRPSLKVIRGDRQGDGKSRASLRLVRSEDTDE